MNYVDNLKEIEFIVDTIKMFFITCYTYYIALKIINKKVFTKNTIYVVILSIIVAILGKCIKNLYGYFYSILCLDLLIVIIFSKMTKNTISYSMLIITISLSINYVLFLISVLLSFIPSVILNVDSNFVSLFIIIILYSMFIYLGSRIRRFGKGIIFLQETIKNESTDIIVLNISIVILFCIIALSNYKQIVTSKIGISIIILSIIMFITIQKSLQLYYKQKLQERESEETKKELENKSKEIEELKEENLKLSKTNHSIAHKLKSLEYEVNQISSRNVIDNNKIMNKIEKLSTEMQDEFVNVDLEKTGISEIDTMLEYMQSECIKSKIEFELQINGNIHHMINKYIEKEDLEILLADHIKNAIIAINNSENINKNILVRIGIIDGFYSLYIYDSGIEFELETLINLGIKPSTTHEDDGGTGMGFMNTFDTLRKYKASLIIQEYGKPSKDNFTKVIKIIFDNKNEYKVLSYREKEIKEKDKNKRVSI